MAINPIEILMRNRLAQRLTEHTGATRRGDVAGRR